MDGDKEVLQTMDAKVRRLGFQSGEGFSQALLDFIDAHTWAFERLTSAHVMHMGGIEALQDPPKLVEIVLRCRPSYRVERNPASAFHVVGQGIHPLSAHLCRHPKAQENWDMAAPTRENTHNTYLKMGDPTYVCLIPVMYVVEGVSISEMFFYPQYRWTHPEPRPSPSSPTSSRCARVASMTASRCASLRAQGASCPGGSCAQEDAGSGSRCSRSGVTLRSTAAVTGACRSQSRSSAQGTIYLSSSALSVRYDRLTPGDDLR